MRSTFLKDFKFADQCAKYVQNFENCKFISEKKLKSQGLLFGYMLLLCYLIELTVHYECYPQTFTGYFWQNMICWM